MAAMMSIVEATVPGENWPELQTGWVEMLKNKPEQILNAWLVQGLDGRDTWCVVGIWESREAFEEYRRSVDAPAAVKLFRSVEAEPALATFEVIATT